MRTSEPFGLTSNTCANTTGALGGIPCARAIRCAGSSPAKLFSGNFAGCSEGHVSIYKMFYVFLLFIFGQNSLGFRINENEQIIATAAIQNFHIETQVRSCGCEEKSALEELKSLKWTPEDFMTHHGKLWLGGVEAENVSNCSKMCQLVNKRTTHFTFESKYRPSLSI